MSEMKRYWVKRMSIVLAALLLLAVLPVSAMAEKETQPETVTTEEAGVDEITETEEAAVAEITETEDAGVDEITEKPDMTATVSDAEKITATSSDAYEDGELLDGQVANDIPSEEADLTDGIIPEKPEAVPEIEPAAVPAEVPEKEAEADITGTWTVDEITNYRFDKNGEGELLLPEHTYSFHYTTEDNELTLEFDNDNIRTAVFTFELEDEKLILKREEETGTSEFTLEKTAD